MLASVGLELPAFTNMTACQYLGQMNTLDVKLQNSVSPKVSDKEHDNPTYGIKEKLEIMFF